MDRGYIYVNKKSFINNLQYLSQVSKKKICLVVKANAYGHGIKWSVRNAKEIGVEWFAVASIDEGIQVKKEFKDSRVLLLAEPSASQIDNILKNDLDLTVYSDSFIDALIGTGYKYNVHLKIDTGMHRIGCSPEKFDYFLKKINDSKLNLSGICTHFPEADTNKGDTQKAIDLFKNTISNIDTGNLLLHVDNSASTFYNLDDSFNMVRVGIAAYGVEISPVESLNKLKPTMEIKTRISNLQHRKKGEAVSYGKAKILDRDSVIATSPIGYGDGYPWNTFPDGKVIVKNQFCKLIGRVTMDQILFDVTGLDAQIDDEVTVLGNSDDGKLNISVSDIANWNKTIEWEILTNMSKRLDRVEVE
ncbi:MAG: alanine racemase [Candidatus Actinomarina sp.]